MPWGGLLKEGPGERGGERGQSVLSIWGGKRGASGKSLRVGKVVPLGGEPILLLGLRHEEKGRVNGGGGRENYEK